MITTRNDRDKIQADIKRFLSAGGKIQKIRQGVSGQFPISDFIAINERKKERQAVVNANRDIGTKAAAKLLDMGERWLRTLCARNEGPPHYKDGQKLMFEREALLKWGMSRE
jgi:hypothetical protein